MLLRGNHETSSLTRTYGFYDEVLKKYGNYNVWTRLIEVFSYLPLAAVIDQSVLCLHGGLSPALPFIDTFSEIDRVGDIPESGPMCDLVWSDPDISEKEGWSVNSRGAGYVFSSHVAKEFLELNGLQTLVRAHQLAEEGHCYNFGEGEKWFVTVWSAPNYCYRCGNEASVMRVEGPGQNSFIQF
jgi:diadenosine tetraphosphatase ApaH/serine/threonine PP2A family protein phosphatase